MAGVRQGAFTCVGWQVTLCDPIWQVTSRSLRWGSHEELYRPLLLPFFTAVNVGLGLHAQNRTSITHRQQSRRSHCDRLHGTANIRRRGKTVLADNSGNDRRRTPATDNSEPSTLKPGHFAKPETRVWAVHKTRRFRVCV